MTALPHELFARYGRLMASYGQPWAVCGGWAIDTWLGRQTRDHADFDISLFEDGQQRLFEHLSGWHLVAHDAAMVGNSTELWDGQALKLPAHLHARPPGEGERERLTRWVTPPFRTVGDGLDLDIKLNRRQRGQWLLSSKPRLSLPLGRALRDAPSGLPTAAPEVLVFYKATAYWGSEGHPRPHDLPDVLALVPLLEPAAFAWLRAAVAATVPGHPWLAYLR